MKKTILIPVLLVTLTAFTPVYVYAGATDATGGTNTNEVSPNSEARDMSMDDDDGEDNDYGWIGLLGLLGLAGLMKRDRVDTSKNLNR